MNSVENLTTYNKFINLIKEGLLLIPDLLLSKTAKELHILDCESQVEYMNKEKEVTLNAKKVIISYRGSIRDYTIDGKECEDLAQAACMICDPYDEYIDIQDEIRSNLLDYSFIPIIDPTHDNIRYTISKYSKGLRKFFDPHKVIKAIYTINHILFYVNEENDKKKKYLFKIGSINVNDMIPSFCKMASLKNGINSDIYLAFFIEEENLPFTFGTCKEDFYLLKDILNRICFKGTTPLKYMIFKDIKEMNDLNLKQKEMFAYNNALLLTNLNKNDYCKKIGIEEELLDKLLSNEVNEVKAKHHKKINKTLVKKYLNIIDNVNELKFYEKNNLIWKVQYKDIPDVI